MVSCAAADGTQVVVKLVVTREEMRAEAAALTAWARTGAAARLIDTDFDHGALLLEQSRQGRAHATGTTTQGPSRSPPACSARFTAPRSRRSPSRHRTRPLPGWTAGRAATRPTSNGPGTSRNAGDPASSDLPLAPAAATRLCHSPPRTVLLHGDFLAKNLLSNGTGYVAIDPIPNIGDPCADVGFFTARAIPPQPRSCTKLVPSPS